MLRAVPLLVLPVLIYVAVSMFGGSGAITKVLIGFPLPSGATFAFDVSTAVLSLGATLLLVEIYKSTSVKNSSSIVDHALSTVLLIGAILMFVLMPNAGTPTFFVLVLMIAIDVIAGFSVSVKTAQRDFQVDKTFS